MSRTLIPCAYKLMIMSSRPPATRPARLGTSSGSNVPARSRDEAGGLRLTGEGSMLGELVKVVLERALEAELTGHLGYERHGRERPAGCAWRPAAGRGSRRRAGRVFAREPGRSPGPFRARETDGRRYFARPYR